MWKRLAGRGKHSGPAGPAFSGGIMNWTRNLDEALERLTVAHAVAQVLVFLVVFGLAGLILCWGW